MSRSFRSKVGVWVPRCRHLDWTLAGALPIRPAASARILLPNPQPDSMPDLPVRHSLVNQTAEILRAEIVRGSWTEWLPSERALCRKFQVSRNTLRAALDRMKREHLIRALHGSGNQILVRPETAVRKAQVMDAALLTPEGMERLRPSQSIMIDELRALLGEHGCRLHVFHGAQYFRTNPGAALKKLLAQNPHGCWILLRSNAPVQRWFRDNFNRCVVAGSVHGGLELAHRDVDHRAVCRHAAGLLLGLGHRRLALVVSRPPMAGDLESEAGMLEAVRQSPHSGVEAVICQHDGTVDGIGHALRRLMAQRTPPTALLVANAHHFLAVSSHLTQLGLRVPGDVSLISRDDDLFLSYLVPSPSRYVTNPQAFAKLLLRAVLEILEDGQASQAEVKLMPDFERGGSVAVRR